MSGPRFIDVPKCKACGCERKPMPPNKYCWQHHAESWEIHQEKMIMKLFPEEYE